MANSVVISVSPIRAHTNRVHRQFQPVCDQHPLNERRIQMPLNDFHQPASDLSLCGIGQPFSVDLSQHLLGRLMNFHLHLRQPFFGVMASAGIDNRVQLELIDLRKLSNGLEAKSSQFDRHACHVSDFGDPAAQVSNHCGINCHHH